MMNTAAGAWPAIQAISNADSSSLFDTLAAASFNAVSVALIWRDIDRFPTTSGNHYASPDWNNGSTVPPFTSAGDFSTFGATYKAHARERVDYMVSKGLLPILTLCYPGYLGDTGTSNQGFAASMIADTGAHLQAYGAAAETLFADIPRLIWNIGGDVTLTDATLLARTMSAVTGVRSVSPGRFWFAHLGGSNTGIMPYEHATISTIPHMLQSMYRYADDLERAWWGIEEAYSQGPTGQFDPAYEGDPGPAEDRARLRYRTHSTMCAGACMMAYSRGDASDGLAWYEMTTASWLTSAPGLQDHIYAYQFWSALPWWTMVPDLTSSYVTSGRGTHSSTSDNYISARVSAACAVLYFPDSASGAPVVDMSKFTGAGTFSPAGQRRARWWTPTSNPAVGGSYTTASGSPFTTSGTQTFTQPSSAEALLLID